MSPIARLSRWLLRREAPRGQAILEMALILPVLLLIVLGTLEFGFIMDHKLTIQYASREGARVGAALANGPGMACADVDNEIIAAVSRILQSSDSRIDLDQIHEIRIFESDLGPGPDGREDVGTDEVNVWGPYSVNAGPPVGGDNLDFVAPGFQSWTCAERSNTGATPDSIGVSVSYTYISRTPLAALINLLQIDMYDFTVFELNPTNN